MTAKGKPCPSGSAVGVEEVVVAGEEEAAAVLALAWVAGSFGRYGLP